MADLKELVPKKLESILRIEPPLEYTIVSKTDSIWSVVFIREASHSRG